MMAFNAKMNPITSIRQVFAEVLFWCLSKGMLLFRAHVVQYQNVHRESS